MVLNFFFSWNLMKIWHNSTCQADGFFSYNQCEGERLAWSSFFKSAASRDLGSDRNTRLLNTSISEPEFCKKEKTR